MVPLACVIDHITVVNQSVPMAYGVGHNSRLEQCTGNSVDIQVEYSLVLVQLPEAKFGGHWPPANVLSKVEGQSKAMLVKRSLL